MTVYSLGNHCPDGTISDTELKAAGYDSDPKIDQLAQTLLKQFPLDTDFSSGVTSKKLLDKIARRRLLFKEVSKAIDDNVEICTLPAVVEYIQEFSAKCPIVINRSFYEKLRSVSLETEDRYFSFVHENPWKVEKMFEWIDQEDIILLYVQKYGPTFFKEIALFVEGKPLTWSQLADEYIRKGCNDINFFNRFFNHLPLSWLFPKKRSKKTSEQTFQDFAFQKIIAEFEKFWGIKLSEENRNLLYQKLKDASFRKDLIYAIGYPDRFESEKKSSPLYNLILLKKFHSFSEPFSNTILTYFLKSCPTDPVEFSSKISPIDQHVVHVQNFKIFFKSEEVFNQYAFTILLIIKDWDPLEMGTAIERFCFQNRWDFYEFELEGFLSFLKEGGPLKDTVKQSEDLVKFLTKIGAKGKSPLFLKSLLDEINFQNLFCVIEGQITTKNALRLLNERSTTFTSKSSQ